MKRKHYFHTPQSIHTAFSRDEFNVLKANSADIREFIAAKTAADSRVRDKIETTYDYLEHLLPNFVNKLTGICYMAWVVDLRRPDIDDETPKIPYLYCYYDESTAYFDNGYRNGWKYYDETTDGSRLFLIDNGLNEERNESNAFLLDFGFAQMSWYFVSTLPVLFLNYLDKCRDFTQFQENLITDFTSNVGSPIPWGYEAAEFYQEKKKVTLDDEWQKRYDAFIASLPESLR